MKKIAIAALALFVVFSLGIAASQFLSMQHYVGHMQDEAATGAMQHDEVNMPMLNGVDTTKSEVSELKALFQNHKDITRSVELLPNGIKTLTETKDEELRAALVGHSAGMITRVEQGKNPQIPIQSLTLKTLFEGRDTIVTEIEITDYGIAIIQTSTDPKVVAALQEHALEVSDLAKRGMEAVHEQMMKQHH
ncbi:hypothetical protein N9D61_00885 [Planktomarina sp.]|nr:hypothetical protein [Planktomarina sp.]